MGVERFNRLTRDGQPYQWTVDGFEFLAQAFSERPPYLWIEVMSRERRAGERVVFSFLRRRDRSVAR